MGTSGPLLDIAVGRKLVEIAGEGAPMRWFLGLSAIVAAMLKFISESVNSSIVP